MSQYWKPLQQLQISRDEKLFIRREKPILNFWRTPAANPCQAYVSLSSLLSAIPVTFYIEFSKAAGLICGCSRGFGSPIATDAWSACACACVRGSPFVVERDRTSSAKSPFEIPFGNAFIYWCHQRILFGRKAHFGRCGGPKDEQLLEAISRPKDSNKNWILCALKKVDE